MHRHPGQFSLTTTFYSYPRKRKIIKKNPLKTTINLVKIRKISFLIYKLKKKPEQLARNFNLEPQKWFSRTKLVERSRSLLFTDKLNLLDLHLWDLHASPTVASVSEQCNSRKKPQETDSEIDWLIFLKLPQPVLNISLHIFFHLNIYYFIVDTIYFLSIRLNCSTFSTPFISAGIALYIFSPS